MTSARNDAQPVIIKRKKVTGGDGHHGGAWKVAYADFVTAMMAFFMLMWLLNATTEQQRKGIADYFNPTIAVNRVSGGGADTLAGDSLFDEATLAHTGTGGSVGAPGEDSQSRGDSGVEDKGTDQAAAEEQSFAKVESMLQGFGGESMVTQNLARHIVTRVTDEGLIIELFDLTDQPLFEADGATPAPILDELAQMLVGIFGMVRNDVAVQGHIRSLPEVLRENPSWDLSTARAQATRQLLEADGLPATRVQRVTGFADRRHAVENPMSERNNRIELILLRDQGRKRIGF